MDEATKREILADAPLFKNLLAPELALITQLVAVRELAPGAIVFEEGQAAGELLVVAEGCLEVLVKNRDGALTQVALLFAPSFFGEMSLVDKQPRSATVRVKTTSTLLALSYDQLYEFARRYRNGFTWISVNMARALSTRLREAKDRKSVV
jgi:CRP/FNR family transcriptional regulator, cyclic AMP receptor protein